MKTPLAPLALACAALAVSAAPLALASDGAREIHQACVATGCFPGDAPGFPVELPAGGGYVLTSNLQVPDATTTAISSTAAGVSLDLGGFAVSGVTECTAQPAVCSPVGDGEGIALSGGGSVRNGTIERMGGRGVVTDGILERLTVRSNGNAGITNFDGITHHCIASTNGGTGISAGKGLVLENEVVANHGTGIASGLDTIVRGNRVESDGLVSDGPGISALGSFVWENSLLGNRGPGLEATAGTAYGNNRFQDNSLTAGPSPANQVSGGSQLGPNLCQEAPCP